MDSTERNDEHRTSTGLRLNLDRLIATVVAGQVAHPLVRSSPYRIGRDGVLRIVPGSGGISLNRRVGDPAVGLAGDHVEPGVSIRNHEREPSPGAANRALMALSCVGNRARVLTGPASGAMGTVTGKHGGINHLLIDFEPRVLRRLRIGDRIQIVAYGQGLSLLDYPDVRALNLSPRLLRGWGVRERAGRLIVPVTHMIPASLMGSGLGRSEGVLGDCDVQLSDAAARRRHRLDSLRLGDLVAIAGLDYRFGPSRRGGSITIGVVVHSDSQIAGHGPGVTPLLVGSADRIRTARDEGANLAGVMRLRNEEAAERGPHAERAAHGSDATGGKRACCAGCAAGRGCDG